MIFFNKTINVYIYIHLLIALLHIDMVTPLAFSVPLATTTTPWPRLIHKMFEPFAPTWGCVCVCACRVGWSAPAVKLSCRTRWTSPSSSTLTPSSMRCAKKPPGNDAPLSTPTYGVLLRSVMPSFSLQVHGLLYGRSGVCVVVEESHQPGQAAGQGKHLEDVSPFVCTKEAPPSNKHG